MADNTEKFSGKAVLYGAARPNYADGLIERLFDERVFTQGAQIADVGSGTGIFAEQLLSRGCKVYGVEPNADMREVAEERLKGCGGFKSVDGSADDTRLADCSVDAVTAAQAFHWFDPHRFAAECRRILKGGKRAVIIYNVRDAEAPVNRACSEIFQRLCPEFRSFSGGMDEGRIYAFFGGKAEKFVYGNDLVMDRNRFVKRNLSASYAPAADDESYGEFIGCLDVLFDRYSENGVVTIPNRSVAYTGCLK